MSYDLERDRKLAYGSEPQKGLANVFYCERVEGALHEMRQKVCKLDVEVGANSTWGEQGSR